MEEEDVTILVLDQQESQRIQHQYVQSTRKFLENTEPYRMQNWYPVLKQQTFKTHFFGLTWLQAYSLHQKYYNQNVTFKIQQSLKGLQQKVDEAISTYFPDGCFLKLSTRSPKDFCWDYRDPIYFDNTVKSLGLVLKTLGLENVVQPRQLTIQQCNVIYKHLCNFSRERVKIRSGKQFINVFSKSERIVMDLDHLSSSNSFIFRRFKQGDYQGEKDVTISVCLRQWENFKWEDEFRCFYYDYKLTAICSYQQDCYFQEWKGKQEFIKATLFAYFNTLISQLKVANLSKGVIDFFFDGQKIKIIQINVFDENSRASLFSWQKDENLLKNGPLQVRLRQQYSERLRQKLGSMMGMIEKKSFEVIKASLESINSKAYLYKQ